MLDRGMTLMLATIGIYGITGVIWKHNPYKGRCGYIENMLRL